MQIQYRYPHGEREWNPNRTVTIEELWDGSTFDYHPLVVGSQEDYDFLRGMELVRGEELHQLIHTPNFTTVQTYSVEILINREQS